MEKGESNFDLRLSKQTENNQKWAIRYLESIADEKKSLKTIDQYKGVIINFMEFNNNYDINTITIDKVKEFVYQSKSASRKNLKIYAIRRLIEIVSIDKEFSFNIDQINGLIIPKPEVDRDTRKAVPLSIKEIIKIRYALRNDYNRLYVFEMFYQYGLTLDEMVLCTDKTYDYTTKTFKLPHGKNIHVNKIIQDIIEKRPKVLNPQTKYGYKKRNAYQNNIYDIGEKLGRQLTWHDITDTRGTYFFRCHMCNEIYEGIPENWALREYEEDLYKIKWIVCSSCATKEIINE